MNRKLFRLYFIFLKGKKKNLKQNDNTKPEIIALCNFKPALHVVIHKIQLANLQYSNSSVPSKEAQNATGRSSAGTALGAVNNQEFTVTHGPNHRHFGRWD